MNPPDQRAAQRTLWAFPTPGQGRSLGYVFPRVVGVGYPSPPCRVSQVPRLIYSCALVPNHPGRSGECLLIASPPISGFILSGGLATFTGVTRPNRVRLRYGSQVCFPGFRQPVYADSLRFSYMHERAIYMVNSFQFTRSARLSLVYQMNGRVGERATPCGATHSPLVEPDKRISRHPALLKTSRLRYAQAVARLPAFTSLP